MPYKQKYDSRQPERKACRREVECAGKVDGRCYNIRSQNKTKWEVYNIYKLQRKERRRKQSQQGLVRGVFTKEEMAEYKEISRVDKEARADKAQKGKDELKA